MNCVGCESCYFGGKKVGYKGDFTSRLVIVGESPGAMELAKGMPFVGPAGELLHEVLDPLLADTGIEPFITNAIQCLPRQKDPGKLSAAVNACRGRLNAELQAHPRDVIIALGNAALWATTGDHNLKITQVRGQVFASALAAKGIVAAVHPAFLLRGGGNLQQWKRDFQMAIGMLGVKIKGPEVKKMQIVDKFVHGKITVVKTDAELDRLIEDLKTAEVAAGDFETDGFNPRISRTPSPAEFKGKKCIAKEGVRVKGEGLLCMGVCFEKGHSFVIPGNMLVDELFQNEAKWVWQNGKFDMQWAHFFDMPSARVDDDTMLMSYTLNESGGAHDLEQIGSDWLQAPNYKNMLDQYLPSSKHSYAYIPKDVLYKYQGIDAELTFWLRDPMRQRVMADEKLAKVYSQILIPGSKFISQMETNGMMADLEEVAKNEIYFGGMADQYEKAFQELAKPYGYGDINLRSPDQLKAFLYEHLKMNSPTKSTDADEMERLLQKFDNPESIQNKLIQQLKRYRKVHKLLSTYIVATRLKLDPTDGRMHSTFKLHGTTTGRLSSSKPNMQNVPRDPRIRGQFVAAPGRCLLEVDLAQAELRMLGQLSGDPILNAIFLSGASLHDEVATYLFGPNFNKEQKMIAKNVNFGIVYGITAAGLLDQLEINAMLQGTTLHFTIKDAQEWINGWFKRFPVAAAFIDRLRASPMKGQTLVSAFGRKRRWGVVSYDKVNDMMNEAANFPMQSGAHDITLLTGIELEPELRTKYDCLVVNEVHDCLVNDLPNDMSIIIPVASRIIETMERIPREWGLNEVPFKAEAEIGVRWGNFTKFNPTKFNALELKGVRYEEVIKEEKH